ncbi:glycosyltransferase [Cytobacillus firmus]|uniref:glycosyltransferase n=1 Tax=Cytobacillus firmus TaxID=1399 RepID=UPI00202F9A7E|nr:glycosyltransferase [Cytobacillus firmus]URT70590.1 glycosyltransferase [Cytobacillus firmus]
MNLAPIVLFVYNRPKETYNTLKLLEQNSLACESHLFIFSDGPKTQDQIENVNQVRKVIGNIKGFRKISIVKSESNKGLANSVITGVTSVIQKYGKVIVLEDDLETSKYFLTYMNEALDYYQNDKSIWSISGYSPNIKLPNEYDSDLYGVPRACSWGWGTWRDKWEKNDWELKNIDEVIKNMQTRKLFDKPGNDMTYMLKDQKNNLIDSWAIRWCYNQFIDRSLTIYPRYSFVNNIGFTGESTHGSISKKFNTKVSKVYNIKFKEVVQDDKVIKEFAKFYNMNFINYIGRILKTLGIYRRVKFLYKKLRK